MDKEVYDEIMMEISTSCETCPINNKCSEDTCPLWCIEKICEKAIKPRGTYQCFHCLSNTVAWECDYSFEDYGLDGEGIIHVCHCGNCGAEIEYYIYLGDDNE